MGAKKVEKVMLVQPPRLMYSRDEQKRSAPPLGLAYLAAVLEGSYDVRILDAVAEGYWTITEESSGLINYGLTFKEIEERIRQFSPDVVGISSIFSSQHPNASRLAVLVKSISKDVVTVIGGDHPTALPEEVLQETAIDYVILSEGEYSFRDLLTALEEGSGFEEIDGIAFMENGKMVVNPKTSYIKNLDELPFPARHLLPMDLYQKINSPHSEPVPVNRLPYTPMISSRGCPAACTFCSSAMMWGRHNLRNRSAKNVIDEIALLISQGYKEIYFDDDNFIFDKQRAHEILDTIIGNNWDITWSMPNGVALYSLNRELLEKMKRSGCHTLCLPIESGSQRVLSRIIHKPLNLKIVPGLLKDMKELGFYTMGFFMIGFPGETKEEIEQTINYAVDMKHIGMDYCSFFIVIPLPGTEIYKTCKSYSYIEDLELTKLITGKGLISTSEFSPEYLGKIRHKAWAKLNFAANTDFILYPEETTMAIEKARSLTVGAIGTALVAGDVPELVSALERDGFSCVIADGRSKLMTLIEKEKPGILVLERGFRDIDAWELMKRFRKNEKSRGLPILLVLKEDKEKVYGKDITWLIIEVLDKKDSYA